MLKTKAVRYLLWSLALGLTVWTLAQLPLASIAMHIADLTWSQWLVWLAMNMLILGLGVQRWYGLMRMLKVRVGFIHLFAIRQAGQAVNFITPGPQFGGEPLQLLWLRRAGVPVDKALLSLGLDRFYELWINFSVLVICLSLLILLPRTPLSGAYALVEIFAALLLVCPLLLWFAWRQPRGLFVRWVPNAWLQSPRLSKLKQAVQALGRDLYLAWETQKLALLQAVVVSLLGWLALVAELALLLKFVGVSVDAVGLLVVLVALRLALLLPVPGGVGTIEAAIFWSFQSLGLPVSAAAGLIALKRLRDAGILLIGVACMHWAAKKSPAPDLALGDIVDKPTSAYIPD